MADFRGEALDAGGDDGERREKRRVTVARDHLRRNRLHREAEFFRDMFLDARVDIGEGADGAGNRANRDLLARGDQPLARAGKLGVSLREL